MRQDELKGWLERFEGRLQVFFEDNHIYDLDPEGADEMMIELGEIVAAA